VSPGIAFTLRQLVRKALSQFRLDSIRSQILAFAILAALIPSLIISFIAYAQSRSALTDKITQELVTTGSQAGREADVWLKERLYDLRVFANSSVVSETVARRGQPGRAVEYLNSVRARFADYEELQLVDAKAGLVASSARRSGPVRLPEGWAKTFESSRSLVSEPYWDEKAQKMIVILGVPVLQANGRISGALVARTNFSELTRALRVFSTRSTAGHVYLTTARGTLIADSRNAAVDRKTTGLESKIADRLLSADGEIVEHRGIDGVEVLGSAQRLSQAAWLAVADMPVADGYRQAIRLRNMALLVIGILLVVIAVVAYWLSALIARPLGRLTSAAAQVSAGDLSVGLPAGRGEVGYLTQVFNTMVESLRKHHDELEHLSLTDTLTGLSNRRHLMNLLTHEFERARRANQPFSILMLDVDHFKTYNDTHGHQAGDEVLARVSTVLRESIRPYDSAVRYGGEEFLVMLSATTLDRAQESAERIRKQVRAEQFKGGAVTISIGVAEYPSHGDTAKAVIGQADAALYEAKRAGRDRVTCAGPKGNREKAAAS
jgi:diguanylate cyclase (GGDEF)-like protein